MFTVITPLVKAKLDTLKGTGKPLAQVLDYHTEKATGFPFACFESVGFTAEILDTCSNLRTYSYLLLVFQDLQDDKRGEAVAVLEKAVDEIIKAFDADYTLGNPNIQTVVPLGADISPYSTASGKALVAQIRLDVRYRNLISA